MPNRLIKDSIKHSAEIDSLSWFQEVCFYRLMVTVDDYGCYYADPQIIKSDLFPTKESLTKSAVSEALDRLENVGLIERYESGGRWYLHLRSWESHQQIRATKRKFPKPDDAKNNQMISNENICNQMISDDNKCSRNPIQYEYVIQSESESEYIAPAEATAIIHDHDRVISAAENAGFARNDATRKILIDLYALHGLDKMLSAIQECVKYGVSTIAYLEGVLKGGPKKQSHGKLLPAQQYEQRDYSGEDEEAMKRMIRMAEECRA